MFGDMVKNDVDRVFAFVDPLEFVPTEAKHSGEERIRYTRDEVNSDFIATMQRLVTKVKDILNDPTTDPLVGSANELEKRLEVPAS